MSILVTANFDADEWAQWWPALQAAMPGEHLVRQPADAATGHIDVALVATPPLALLRGLSGLRLVQSLWAGVDKLLADPDLPPGVPLARMVDPSMSAAMAETALWAVLSLHRGFFAYAASQRLAQWQPHAQRRAGDVCVAVLGLGQMGRAAALALVQSGYRVQGWSSNATTIDGVATFAGETALAQVLAGAHIVVNLLPLTPATRDLFNATTLARMLPGASLVNLARGGHVVEADLLAALDSGHLRHAVLDVFAVEPLPRDHPFWSHPQVSALPHAAAQTDVRSAAAVVARNVKALREGRPLHDLVGRARGY
jgi:glyoxylate/hydroxypyruvate reductase A